MVEVGSINNSSSCSSGGVTPSESPSPETRVNTDATENETTMIPITSKLKRTSGKKRASLFQIIRLAFLVTTFITGCLSIAFSQFTILILFNNDPSKKQRLLDFTKKNFIVLLTFITSITTPTTLTFTVDNEMQSHLLAIDEKGNVSFKLDPKAIVIANHQIYSDWLFLWYLAYLNNCSEQLFIIMKKSLEKIPVLGYGMRNYNFIFLSRKWELDRTYMINQFNKLNLLTPLKHWLLIFPEGTNLSDNTRSKSNAYCEKVSRDKLKHVLLPRVKGLYTSCVQLSPTTNKIYDITIGYSDHTPEEYAQDIFTLSRIYLFGEGPKEVKLNVREVELDEIKGCNFSRETISEAEDDKQMQIFEEWLMKSWKQKDLLMDNYYKLGKFKSDQTEYKTQLKLKSNWEVLDIYIIPLLTVAFAYLIYKFVQFLGGFR